MRALALRLPLATEVSVDVAGGRADAPVESAAYFAVSEVLTNAVKHSGADRIWVDLRHVGRQCCGSPSPTTAAAARRSGRARGCAGIERRLGTFDGVLAVARPPGGPTMVTMEIPCVLS